MLGGIRELWDGKKTKRKRVTCAVCVCVCVCVCRGVVVETGFSAR